MGVCIVCAANLTGRQKKFCSRLCKNRYSNFHIQSYQAQQLRGKLRKLELVKLFAVVVRNAVTGKTSLPWNFIIENLPISAFSLI